MDEDMDELVAQLCLELIQRLGFESSSGCQSMLKGIVEILWLAKAV